MNKERIAKVIEKMNERRFDQLIVCDPSSIDYLIDYYNDPIERMYVLLIDKSGKLTLFMNNLFFLDKELDLDIVWFKDSDNYVKILSDYVHGRIGVDKLWPTKFLIPLMEYCLDCSFKVGSECIDLVRMVKDEEEQELMIESSKLNDLAVEQMIGLVATGKYSEAQMAEKLTGIFKDLGASGNSFEPIVAYGPNCADGHHVSDDTMVKKGQSIIIDMGCVYKGYCSDLTRTVFYQEVSDDYRRVYELVKKAQEAAEAIVKPGVRLCDIDKCARDIIAKGGYVAEFNHRLGHFVGKDIHEYGDVSSSFEMPVKEGMVFSIEPGVYIQGDFGVRIEDLVLVTKDGCKVLNSNPKDLRVVG